jgi:hypothetical protein
MADHGWLVFAMRDIRDYVEMNGLAHLLPVIKSACTAVEVGVSSRGNTHLSSAISSDEADAKLASRLEEDVKEERPLLA